MEISEPHKNKNLLLTFFFFQWGANSEIE